jgi:hypothetical protein
MGLELTNAIFHADLQLERTWSECFGPPVLCARGAG